MSLFRKKRKIKHLGEVGIHNPLEVIPVVEADTEARRDERGLLQIRRAMQPKRGLYEWVSRKFRFRHDIRINLDEVGSFFWEQIDGRRTLDDVTGAIRKQFDLKLDESRKAVIMFTKVLLLRHLVYLKVPSPAGGKP